MASPCGRGVLGVRKQRGGLHWPQAARPLPVFGFISPKAVVELTLMEGSEEEVEKTAPVAGSSLGLSLVGNRAVR